MKPLNLAVLASACALALTATPASAQFFSCDRIYDVIERSQCQSAITRQQQAMQPAPQMQAPHYREPQHAPVIDNRRDVNVSDVIAALYSIRREDCWEWSGTRIRGVQGLSADGLKDIRTDVILSCLAQTKAAVDQMERRLNSGTPSRVEFLRCADRIVDDAERRQDPEFMVVLLAKCVAPQS